MTGYHQYVFELYTFCHDYHRGQWSRGYRILSRLSGPNTRVTSECMRECRESEAYQHLVDNYADRI